MRPVRLYMNRELTQVQTGVLNLKSAMLRFWNMRLQVKKLVVICVVYVYDIIRTVWYHKEEFYIWEIVYEGHCLG